MAKIKITKKIINKQKFLNGADGWIATSAWAVLEICTDIDTRTPPEVLKKLTGVKAVRVGADGPKSMSRVVKRPTCMLKANRTM